MPLVVTGSVGIDTIVTPASVASNVLGGSCTYFSAAASFLCPVRVVAAVGGDFDPRYREIIHTFQNIDLRGLEVRSGSRTFRWTGKYHEDFNRRDTLEVHPGVLSEAPPKVPAEFADSTHVFLANTHPDNQLAFLESLPMRRLTVADTMDLWITTQRESLNKLLDRIDGLVLNDAESELMTGIANPVRAAKTLRNQHDLRFVIIKKGEHGAMLFHELGTAALPAFPVENVLDPTGAGDSFAGGVMGYLTSVNRTDYEAIQAALAFGTIVSSYTVEAFSLDRLRQISLADLHRRMIEFARAVRVV